MKGRGREWRIHTRVMEEEEESVSDSMKRPCKDFGFYSDEIREFTGK